MLRAPEMVAYFSRSNAAEIAQVIDPGRGPRIGFQLTVDAVATLG
jgi:hypothetical protein